MKATATLDAVRAMGKAEGVQSEVGFACAWAIFQMTGEKIPAIDPLIVWERNWFLTPNLQQ